MESFTGQQILFAVGINHKTAPVEVREKVYIHEEEISEFSAKLRETLSECIILSTCNRTEIYGVHDSADIDTDFYKDLIIKFKNAGDSVEREHFFSFISCAACQQLFKVSTSVDSKIIGDRQILQQLRQAYAIAQEAKATGKILNQLTQRAFKIGKKVRTETSLHKGAVSASLAAVELAFETFQTLENKTVLVIGAGETARFTAESLIKKQVGKIIFTNRTVSKALELLEDLQRSNDFKGEIIRLEDFKSVLNSTDIVISSTGSSRYILTEDDFRDQVNKILLIDIAVPRDIDPSVSNNRNVVLRNIDDLKSIVDKNFERRMKDLPQVKKIIAHEMGDFLMWYYSLPLLPDFKGAKGKPDTETVREVQKIKKFLISNVSEFHKLARQSGSDSKSDLKNHLDFVRKLYEAKSAF
ncbi:MAG: glutamyl-tRNA reductase [Aridibacter sp.]